MKKLSVPFGGTLETLLFLSLIQNKSFSIVEKFSSRESKRAPQLSSSRHRNLFFTEGKRRLSNQREKVFMKANRSDIEAPIKYHFFFAFVSIEEENSLRKKSGTSQKKSSISRPPFQDRHTSPSKLSLFTNSVVAPAFHP